MRQFRRGSYFMLMVALFSAPSAAQRATEGLSGDPRVAWLKENALRIRSINPDDGDFRDLEPLRAALEGVRLVLLGEADHGSGSDFLAKTRLVKFLHRELGFDVLAFETPMYDMTVVWRRLLAGMPPRDAFGLVNPGRARQTLPLAVYLGEQARGRRPLEIAGFDHQHQLASVFHFADDLLGFLSERGVGGPLVNRDSPELRVLQGLAQERYRYGVAAPPDVPTVRAFLDAVEQSLLAVSAMPDERALQWAQILRNVACHTRFVMRNPEIGDCNRDEQMAKNLLWLASERYRDHKIIVWAATSHAARLPDLLSFGPEGGSGPSMGHHMTPAFGSRGYVIGMTSYTGRSSRPNREIVADQHPAAEFEELMASAGFEYGLVDLRRGAAKGSWLAGEFSARPIGHVARSAIWKDLLDALFFVREQEPSQEIEQPAADVKAIKDVRDRQRAAYLGAEAEDYAAFFTDDCVVLPPDGSPIRGRAGVRSWLEGVHQEVTVSGGEIESLALIAIGDWAWELYGTSRTVAPRAGGPAVEERYRGMRIYRRQVDGTWSIAQDIWRAAPPRRGA